ncbi:MarR family transcriptional regulator [Actinocorallia longicatena]|uniref:MarR family transcriptional regulator n=1 Tax=Actinocorallia longicatena TaxID=111803 RepID=A0ABP6QBT0_9ACTN
MIRFVSAYMHDAGASATAQGLTTAQAQLLIQLDEPLPMRVIADRLFCDASNVTGLVDRLETRGLVVRAPDPGDRRVKLVSLTPAGLALCERIRSDQHGLFAALAVLDEDGAAALKGLLGRMTPAIEDARAGGRQESRRGLGSEPVSSPGCSNLGA